jgi:esterase/lipase/1-acyl-sn-glycerol-3-phosphate acyltransferase
MQEPKKQYFIVKATEYALAFLESALHVNIEENFEEAIPQGHSIMFIANHFTRAETLLLPYVIKKYISKMPRSLADRSLFASKFLQDFLAKASVISTGDPLRDDIIIADLIAGDETWLIYPEGKMVKDKLATTTENGQEQFVAKTGAAVLAIKAEQKRLKLLKAYMKQNPDMSHEDIMQMKYVSYNGQKVNTKSVVIVPISITYSPVNPCANKLETNILRFIKKTSPRLKEEIRMETSILLGSKMDLYFSKVIDLKDYISDQGILSSLPFMPQESRDNYAIEKLRHKLTQMAMKTIYNNTLINLQHIFASTIFELNSLGIEHIKLKEFKNILIVKAEVLEAQFSARHRIDKSLIDELHLVKSKEFASILNAAISQDLISINGCSLLLNKPHLQKEHSVHNIRITNILQVFDNDLSYFKEVKKTLSKITTASAEQLNKVSADYLIKKDIKAFENDYRQYSISGESKPKEICKPFLLKAADGSRDVGIVLSHGYKSAPEEMRLLAEYLSSQNINVYCIRLKGHGTAAHNMQHITYNDWIDSFEMGYEILSRIAKNIFIGGFSTGGLVAMAFAERLRLEGRLEKISGLVSINSALRIVDIKFKFARFAKLGIDLVNKFKSGDAKIHDYVVDKPENPHINYSKNYLNGLSELAKLIDYCDDGITKISDPILIIQGSDDPIVDPVSADIIFSKSKSENKTIYKPKRDRHVIVRGDDCEEIFHRIDGFIKSTLG